MIGISVAATWSARAAGSCPEPPPFFGFSPRFSASICLAKRARDISSMPKVLYIFRRRS